MPRHLDRRNRKTPPVRTDMHAVDTIAASLELRRGRAESRHVLFFFGGDAQPCSKGGRPVVSADRVGQSQVQDFGCRGRAPTHVRW
jgi:hypothetical protein